MNTISTLKEYINDAHGDGYDTVELPIETARGILSLIEIAEKTLSEALADDGSYITDHDELTEEYIKMCDAATAALNQLRGG